ncbi:lytic polysaccharide monooxygenase [Vagococcus intermedius]|uniref:Lytic polysaccharide monooxygenase n=1 Tax=Vagococcus intermedius TaxID=2991418 RepID=A0AAF0I850_9ENTE|nr:lytic polysaccharide monooxygenase [Vagococcus intermedius]WEG73576.1 lytic polysaccharide monooxygenase [Vagococcus intermedius]WEG75658.1 lytic polysaccharide monooxygenase [Vagococcus intermedius]
MKKTLIASLTISATLLGLVATFQSEEALAHGYVVNPVSRVKNATENGFTWGNIPGDQQDILNNPQGIETPTSKLDSGELNGHLASAGLARYGSLDEQTSDRWVKNNIKTGSNDFTWHHTQVHKTNRYRYYMTKQGWNPNAPLTLDDMEVIKVEGQPIGQDLPKGKGVEPPEDLTHKIDIPENRSGYHVVYAVWDINDTDMSFYQAIDVNVQGAGSVKPDITAPTAPSVLEATNIFHNSVSLKWNESKDFESGVKEYMIYRDGKQIGTSVTPQFTDKTVKESTTYNYTIKAIDKSGNISKASNQLEVTTLKEQTEEDDTIAPTVPGGLHSMGETESSINLMWAKSEDNVKVEGYNIYRDGKKIKSVTGTSHKDAGLKADTTYSYTVTAFDKAGNESAKSNKLTLKTKTAETTPPEEGNKTTWDESKVYDLGDTVVYKGVEYKAKWWTQGDVPSDSQAWELVDTSEVVEWNSSKAYSGGAKVMYEGVHYQAKWWTQGDTPSANSTVWEVL